MSTESARLKLELLSHGIFYDSLFLQRFSLDISSIEKRRAYGTSDEVLFDKTIRVPQEIILPDSLICAVNYAHDSPWHLCYDYGIPAVSNGDVMHHVRFPARPSFYGHFLSTGECVEEILTVYGNSTLGIFSPGHCYYFNDGRQCRFCSLGAARDTNSDHKLKIKGHLAREAVEIALKYEPNRIKHILINGGTIRNYDKGFQNLTSIIEDILISNKVDGIEKHVISMPPKDFNLFTRLAQTGSTLAMSIEVYDPDLFHTICPGKSADYGRARFLDAYAAAVSEFGVGNVYAGFVAGIEPASTLIEGMYTLADIGVVPAVAVFHRDAGSNFSDHPRPTTSFLAEIGSHMTNIYSKNKFRPLIINSGRNSLDTEAFNGYLA